MTVVRRDFDILARTLEQWLAPRLSDSVAVTGIVAPNGGFSSETYLIDAFLGAGRPARWVLRIQATKVQVYEDPAVEKQYRIMQALQRIGDVPVPHPLWFEGDSSVLGSPFFLMERIEGQAPPEEYHREGVLAEATPAVRETMWRDSIRTMARIHQTDTAPFAFLDDKSLGPCGIDQELARWDRFRVWTDLPGVDILDRGRRWLEDHRPAPTRAGLSWGDARLNNFLFRDNRCVAVLDWETASLGGGEYDLGWWLYFDRATSIGIGMERAEGLGDRAATIALWEAEIGRKAQAMEWHEFFAAWRFGWIVQRAFSLFEAAGIPIPVNSNPAVRRMEELLGEGS